MPTEEQNNGSTSETEGQEQQGQQQGTTSETEGNGTQSQATVDDSTELPETHPLVKKLSIQKGEISTLKTSLAEANANSAKASKLEQELAARPTPEALETLQNRYDRLEAFLVAAGGPLGKVLDSRTFSKELFESDKDIKELVKDFHKANPTATSAALQTTAGGATAPGKQDPNALIRAAWNGSKS